MPISGGSYTLPTNNFAQPVPNKRVQAVDAAETLTDIETAIDTLVTSGLSDGDKGDITVSSNGTVWNIDAGAVGNTEFRDSAALSVVGRSANSTGAVADISAGTDHHVLRRSGASLDFGLLTDNNIDPAAGIAGTKLSFTQAGTGAVARSVQAKLREIVTPQDFTSSTIDDYSTDASSAIQAAIDYAATTGKQVYIPAGTYKVGTALEVKGNGTSLIGDGPLATILKSPNASNPIITFANGISNIKVRRLELTRAVTATVGGDGLSTPTDAYTDCILEEIWSRNNYNGFALGATAYAKGRLLRSENNISHGFFLTNSLAANGGQWYLSDIYSGNNGQNGFFAYSDPAATVGFPIGELINFQCFGNSGKGFAAIGTPTCPIQSVRGAQWFLGQDGDDEVYLDTYGVNHVIDGLFIELPGTIPTGPTNSTPASNIGHGVNLTANNADVQLSNGKINGCSLSGVISNTPFLRVTNVKSINNGQAGTAGALFQSGFYIYGGKADFNGVESRNTGGTTQKHGIYFANDDEHTVTSSRLRGNATAPIGSAVTLTSLTLDGNTPASVRTSNLTSPGGRLTLTTAIPVISTNVSDTATIYYTPFLHRFVPLWNGVNWSMHDIGGELAYSINESTYSPAPAATSIPYDLFVWDDNGTYRLTKGPAWSSASARGSGAGTTQLTRLNGMFVNAVAITNGPAANRGLYVGTIYANVSALMSMNCFAVNCNGSAAANRCEINVWNMYNRVDLVSTVHDSTASWTYALATVRQQNGQANAGWDVVQGRAEDGIDVEAVHYFTSGSATVNHDIGVGINSTTAFTGTSGSTATPAASSFIFDSLGIGVSLAPGRSKINLLESVPQATSCTIYGGTPRTSKLRFKC